MVRPAERLPHRRLGKLRERLGAIIGLRHDGLADNQLDLRHLSLREAKIMRKKGIIIDPRCFTVGISNRNRHDWDAREDRRAEDASFERKDAIAARRRPFGEGKHGQPSLKEPHRLTEHARPTIRIAAIDKEQPELAKRAAEDGPFEHVFFRYCCESALGGDRERIEVADMVRHERGGPFREAPLNAHLYTMKRAGVLAEPFDAPRAIMRIGGGERRLKEGVGDEEACPRKTARRARERRGAARCAERPRGIKRMKDRGTETTGLEASLLECS